MRHTPVTANGVPFSCAFIRKDDKFNWKLGGTDFRIRMFRALRERSIILTNMEEREELKRQIEILQNLINNHKRFHGDNPPAPPDQPHAARPVSTRGRGRSTSYARPGGKPASDGSWRNTYSLSNKVSQSSTRQASASASSSSSAPSSGSRNAAASHRSTSPPDDNCEGTGIVGEVKEGGASGVAQGGNGQERNTIATVGEAITENVVIDAKKGGTDACDASVPQETSSREISDIQQKPGGKQVVLPPREDGASMSTDVSSNSAVPQRSTSFHVKPHGIGKASIREEETFTVTTPSNVTACNPISLAPTLPGVSQHLPISSRPRQALVTSSPVKKSKFTWVKDQSMGGLGPKQTQPMSQSLSKLIKSAPLSASGEVRIRSPPATTAKRTPIKKLSPRLSLATASPKTSKYTWVSSSAGGHAKLSRKPISPKVLAPDQRVVVKGEAGKRFRPTPVHTKSRKVLSPSATISPSRYRWKAAGQSASGAVAGVSTGTRRGPVFQWTKVVPGIPLSHAVHGYSQPSSSPDGYKLRSRMKIIRKSPSSSTAGVLSGKYALRGRMHIPTRSPAAVRKFPSKELVSFGRHKLRRLSPTCVRKGHTSPVQRGPVSQRVFRTRYKMVTRRLGAGAAHTLHYSPPLSWRAKRIQFARTVLQSRLRAPQDRHQPPQHWRGRGMRWIGGSLYRVSANKLSRTGSMSTSINRTGKWFSPLQVSSPTHPLGRPSNTRHVASRAVQRSLAIIRNARQKKQQRQYCMYYNRFGKCNRGGSCPYIHDPDKVAVCTRFLRGTCKQAEGACPFSHKVAKEKMPVCSYFLKGICNNSSCPYSHVYVSRKAAVCQDFIKGYCPQGEKCKKKHTLVCPEFSRTGSCPQGSRCKLQHRQQSKRCPPSSPTAPARRARTKDSAKRPQLSVVMPPPAEPATPTSGHAKLPSFISLSSSPEEAEAPDTAPAGAPRGKEKKLQIKPRLKC